MTQIIKLTIVVCLLVLLCFVIIAPIIIFIQEAREAKKSHEPRTITPENNSDGEANEFNNKYIRKMRLEIDDNGILKIKVQEE